MIRKFNEEAFWRKPNIDDLYISNPKSIPSINGPMGEDGYIYGMSVPDLDLAKDIQYLSMSRGIFKKTTNYFTTYEFSYDFYKDDIWLNINHVFPKLRKISDQLGLKVGKLVSNGHENLTIENINPYVFYIIYNEVFKKGVETICTLCYELSDGKKYQASKIKLVDGSSEMSIISEEIEDNFLDLIDDNKLVFSCKQDKLVYKCNLVVTMDTPQLLDDISTRLLVMSKRLEIKNIKIKITSMSVNLIQFDAIQN